MAFENNGQERDKNKDSKALMEMKQKKIVFLLLNRLTV